MAGPDHALKINLQLWKLIQLLDSTLELEVSLRLLREAPMVKLNMLPAEAMGFDFITGGGIRIHI